jgi:glycosyltransferase involved in cell wall biosynthesis
VFRANGELESRVDLERVTMLEVKRLRNNDPTLPFRLAWQLRRLRIDILHTHSWGTLVEGVVAAKLARTSVVLHGEHGIMETRLRNIAIQRKLWSWTQQITAVAAPLADQMASLISFPRERIQVIPNGVDIDKFSPRPEMRNEYRRQFGLAPSDQVIGMAARLTPVKNHRGVLAAVRNLANAGMPVTLALAGDGPLRSELQRVAHDLNLGSRVRFLGDLPNVDQFLNSLDVFVLNSDSEGMSNTILEAMACGLPVIATNVGSNSEVVRDNETGLLVPPRDCAALTHAISSLVVDDRLRQSMGAKGRSRILQLYTMDKMVRNYSQLYHNLGEKHVVGHHTLFGIVPRRNGQETHPGATT